MQINQHNKPRVELLAQDLTVSYGSEVALRIPQLKIRGNILAVIGHNGSGKSTLIKSILELLAPRSGNLATSYCCENQKFRLVPEEHMAFSPENGAVFADVSVESYIKLWCRIKHGRSDYYRHDGSIYIEKLNITPLLSKQGKELSKGQRRRVQSVVGFLSKPKLFLFDEPFDGLDLSQSTSLATTMQEESRDMAMIISSHRMEVVERLADQVLVLNYGRVLTYGTVAEVCSTLCGPSVLVPPSLTEAMEFHFRNLH